MQSVLSRIRNEKQDFVNNDVELAPGYFFNQRRTILRIENYFHSRFESGPLDDDGWTKPFYNIVRKPVQVTSKEIDLDTKDVIIRPENGDFETAEIEAAELKQWMKAQGFAADLNEYADLCPEYGSLVVKKVKKKLFTVDLKGLVLTNVCAKSLDHTDVIEPHVYSRDEFLKAGGENGWDKVKMQEVLDAHDAAGVVDITVDERYGWVTKAELEAGGSEDEMVYTMCLAAGTDLTNTIAPAKEGDAAVIEEKGVILLHEKTTKHPYREWHFSKMRKRWLGVGLVEVLFDAQVRANEIAYYKAKGLQWLGLHFFVSDDDTISKNLFNDAKDGDIIRLSRAGGMFQEIQVQERNLAYYASEEERWDRLAADLTFTPEIITGEGLPSGTPARSAIITDQNVKRFFDRKREDFGIFVKGLIENDILPLFEENHGEEHTFSFSGSGDDREALERRVLNTRLIAIFQDYVSKQGRIPSSAEWARILNTERQRISNANTIDIKVPKGAYSNLKKRIDVVITKENEDTDAMLAGRQAILKILAVNPEIATNPVTRPIFMQLANLMGVKNLNLPTQAEIQSLPMPPQMQQPGPGGPATPAAPAAELPAGGGEDVLANVPVPA